MSDCSSRCILSCDCSSFTDSCAEWQDEFYLGPPDEALGAVCRRYNEAIFAQGCDRTEADAFDCPLFSRAAHADLEAELECMTPAVTAEGCSLSWEPCTSEASGELAARFVEEASAVCVSGTSEHWQYVAESLVVYHPGVVALAFDCLREDSRARAEECLDAWLAATDVWGLLDAG